MDGENHKRRYDMLVIRAKNRQNSLLTAGCKGRQWIFCNIREKASVSRTLTNGNEIDKKKGNVCLHPHLRVQVHAYLQSNQCCRQEEGPADIPWHIPADKVELLGAGVEHRVEVLVVAKLGLQYVKHVSLGGEMELQRSDFGQSEKKNLLTSSLTAKSAEIVVLRKKVATGRARPLKAIQIKAQVRPENIFSGSEAGMMDASKKAQTKENVNLHVSQAPYVTLCK